MISSVVGSVLLLQLLFMLAYRSPFKLFMLAFGPIALGILLGFGGYSVVQTGLTSDDRGAGRHSCRHGDRLLHSATFRCTRAAARRGHAASKAAAGFSLGHHPRGLRGLGDQRCRIFCHRASSVKALRDFSLLGILGLAGAFLAAVLLLPMLLMLTDRRKGGVEIRSRFRFGVEPMLRWIARHSRGSIWMSAAIFLAAMADAAIFPWRISAA